MCAVVELERPRSVRKPISTPFECLVLAADSEERPGAIPLKQRELMALAAALTTECPYCIETHTRRAKKAGATEAELTEAAVIAATLQAGGHCPQGKHARE